ncbi:hypothetical protein BGZ99_009247 [Dissophora globulifera]|uniref:Uncharacterized protein n=1 Tax=Dissophora globulifera TaxID=979702 RepID=A0A9P6R9B8_9FUNG|nr:hypothetical protein BGZ99_009247 [Dissophora globulifera]
MSSLNAVREYLFSGATQIAALTAPISPLEKRGLMRIEKRTDTCSSTAYMTTYCPDGYHCVSEFYCKKNVNYVWIAAVGGVVLLCIIIACIRRSCARSAATPQAVVVPAPGQAPNQATYYPPQQFAPPPSGASAAPGVYPPLGSSPYPEKPIEAYPVQSPPAVYSSYPLASGSHIPASEFNGGPAAPAPYPVPQGEAHSYAPPK